MFIGQRIVEKIKVSGTWLGVSRLRGIYATPEIWWGFATTDPPRLIAPASLSPSCASALPSLAWSCTQYAISDGDLTTAWGKILRPSGETAIFRELFGGEAVAFLGVSRSHYMGEA